MFRFDKVVEIVMLVVFPILVGLLVVLHLTTMKQQEKARQEARDLCYTQHNTIEIKLSGGTVYCITKNGPVKLRRE